MKLIDLGFHYAPGAPDKPGKELEYKEFGVLTDGDFTMPDQGASACLRALWVKAQKRRQVECPDYARFSRATELVCSRHWTATESLRCRVPADPIQFKGQLYAAALSYANLLDHGSGLPLSRIDPTVRPWLTENFDYTRQEVFKMFDRIESETFESIAKMAPLERVEKGLMYPVQVFVKNEPHASRKTRTGDLRLIWPVGLLWSLLERMLYLDVNAMDTRCTKLGLDTHYAAGCDLEDPIMFERWSRYRGLLRSKDFRGWDLQYPMFLMLYAVLPDSDRMSDWAFDFAMKIELLMSWPVAVIGSRMYCMTEPGMMCSGRFRTTPANTHGNAIATQAVANVHFAIRQDCAGDDGIDEPQSEDLSFYGACGMELKEAHISDRYVDFCSHTFDLVNRRLRFNNFQKSLAHYMSQAVETRDPTDFLRVNKLCPEIGSFVEVVLRQGHMFSQEILERVLGEREKLYGGGT